MHYRILLVTALSYSLAGCSATPPNYGGNWAPVNEYAKDIQEIPLTHPYRYYALPIDKTLKNLLGRWAMDTGTTLSYQHTSDFSLNKQAGEIRTATLAEALAALQAIYRTQGIRIEQTANNTISVTTTSDSKPSMP
ncbi:hypothetical protein [Leeia oryzae]|uniref:hypothetical protein n=1 Tax=Leeia oryzae TaxID=356662 RepID=UPI00038163FC|nr:hypothetical protein [Leeia oryzae]